MKNRHKFLYKFLSVCLILCMFASVGCSEKEVNNDNPVIQDMEPEVSNAVSYNFIGGKDVMPIGGFYGPRTSTINVDGELGPDLISDEIFSMISDVGINLITAAPVDYSSMSEEMIKYLDLAEKYGIGLFVNDSIIISNKNNEEFTVSDAAKQIKKYYDYPAFCGMHLVDEPTAPYYKAGDGSNDISQYGRIAKIMQEDLGLDLYANMFPIVDYKSEASKENYQKYVKEFVETIHPNILMWDFYPYNESTGSYMREYFWNMDLMRQYALEYEIPFWAFIQAGSQWNDAREYFDSELPYFPNEAQFNWNVNTSLAFGAQGIQYFPLIQPTHFAYAKTNDWDFERNGIIGAAGNTTIWYNYAKNINTHIGVIDEVLMNSVSKGIIVNGESAKAETVDTTCILEAGSFRELQSVSGDSMVGCFNYNGKTALYVVNFSREYAQNITLDFNATHKLMYVQNAEKSYVETKTLTLDMAAGEGVLVVLE